MKLLATLSVVSLSLIACGAGKKEIQNLGSDTLLEVAGALAEAYGKTHPDIAISVSGGGSGVGIKNLIDGDVDIANSSRPMKQKEIDEAKHNGQNPVQHKIGFDGIAIYVHKDNPLQSITLEQLKELFGDGGKLTKWSELGVTFAADSDKVVLASRQNNSGTYECFRDGVLGGDKARFKQECNNLNGSKDVVDFCGQTKSAIGYSGIAYATKDVRVLPVATKTGAVPVTPTIDSILDATYGISRPLFMYTNGEPTGDIKSYLDWIKGDGGQRVLQDKGYVPLRKL